MNLRRVVVTGMGTVNPLAHNVPETWDRLVKGESGVGPITKFDASTFTCRIAGEVKGFDWTPFFADGPRSTARKLDPFVHYAAAACREALNSAGLKEAPNPDRAGFCVGSGIGGFQTQSREAGVYFTKGHKRISPFYIPGHIGNIASGYLSMEFGFKGPNLSVQTACATGNHAIGSALHIIQAGMADIMFAGGTEATIIEMAVAGFCNMKALSTSYNDNPTKGSRPFDSGRDGFVMGEGAGVLLLEEYEHAKKRGAPILAEVMSVGMSADAYDLVAPHPEGEGAARSMKMAMGIAGVNPADVDYINAHGTSTPQGDIAESKAILKALDGKQDHVHVGSTKSMTGHLLGATAGLEAIVCVMAILKGIVPPTINLENPDPNVVLTCINGQAVEKPVKVAMSNSFGFGGHNSTLVLKAL